MATHASSASQAVHAPVHRRHARPQRNWHTTDLESRTFGGKLAQIGSRLIDGAAAKMADDFFARFALRVAPPQEVAVGQAVTSVGTEPARSHLVRYIALAVMAIIIIVLAIRGFR